MVSRKQMANGPIATPLPSAPISISMLPAALRFPLVVVFSLTLSSVFYSLSSAFTAGDLSSVSRSLNEWWEVAGLVGWKATELAIGWWGQYDGTFSLLLLQYCRYNNIMGYTNT